MIPSPNYFSDLKDNESDLTAIFTHHKAWYFCKEVTENSKKK